MVKSSKGDGGGTNLSGRREWTYYRYRESETCDGDLLVDKSCTVGLSSDSLLVRSGVRQRISGRHRGLE